MESVLSCFCLLNTLFYKGKIAGNCIIKVSVFALLPEGQELFLKH